VKTPITPKTPVSDLPEYLTVNEVCAYLRTSRNVVYDAVRTGQFPSRRFAGRQIRIPRRSTGGRREAADRPGGEGMSRLPQAIRPPRHGRARPRTQRSGPRGSEQDVRHIPEMARSNVRSPSPGRVRDSFISSARKTGRLCYGSSDLQAEARQSSSEHSSGAQAERSSERSSRRRRSSVEWERKIATLTRQADF
jgi:excisionase family DNA binding protein